VESDSLHSLPFFFNPAFRLNENVEWLNSFLSLEDDSSGFKQDIDHDNKSSSGRDWQHGYEISRIKSIIGSHLIEVQGTVHPSVGMFVEFYLLQPVRQRLFARILHLEGIEPRIEKYEFLLPRLKSSPIFLSALGKEVEIITFFYFYIPIFVSSSEESEFVNNKVKINEKGFILKTSDLKFLLQSYPAFNRQKLPWLVVVSSAFLKELKAANEKALGFLGRMAIGDHRILINYKPLSKYTLKEKLELSVSEADAYLRDAPNLDWALEYLDNDLKVMLFTPFDQLFKKEAQE
jgi:hypothetical protein